MPDTHDQFTLDFVKHRIKGELFFASDGTCFDLQYAPHDQPVKTPEMRINEEKIVIVMPPQAPNSLAIIGNKLFVRIGATIYECSKESGIVTHSMSKRCVMAESRPDFETTRSKSGVSSTRHNFSTLIDKTAINPTTLTATLDREIAIRFDTLNEGKIIDKSTPGLKDYSLAAIHREKLIFIRRLAFGSVPSRTCQLPGAIFVNDLVSSPMHLDDDSPFIFFISIHPTQLIVLDTTNAKTTNSLPLRAVDIAGISQGLILIHADGRQIFGAALPEQFKRTDKWDSTVEANETTDWKHAYDNVVSQLNKQRLTEGGEGRSADFERLKARTEEVERKLAIIEKKYRMALMMIGREMAEKTIGSSSDTGSRPTLLNSPTLSSDRETRQHGNRGESGGDSASLESSDEERRPTPQPRTSRNSAINRITECEDVS